MICYSRFAAKIKRKKSYIVQCTGTYRYLLQKFSLYPCFYLMKTHIFKLKRVEFNWTFIFVGWATLIYMLYNFNWNEEQLRIILVKICNILICGLTSSPKASFSVHNEAKLILYWDHILGLQHSKIKWKMR